MSGENLDEEVANESSHPFIGVLLSVAAAVLVGGSFILQKKGLMKSHMRSKPGVSPHLGFGYLKQCHWWLGMLSMAVGEIINFMAYTIAPAILITPLGALRVIVSAVLSSIFLDEKLTRLGKLGVLLSLLGSTVIVIHAPRHEKVSTFEELVVRFSDPGFLVYCAVLTAASLALIFRVAPRHGRTNVLVYVTICNVVGALTVLCGKGLGIALRNAISPPPGAGAGDVLAHALFWVLVAGNAVGIPTQVLFLNKALAMFATSAITPIKYVCTNVLLIVGSMLLFEEFVFLSPLDGVGMACGFVTVGAGVVLLSAYKDGGGGRSKSGGDDEQEMSLLE